MNLLFIIFIPLIVAQETSPFVTILTNFLTCSVEYQNPDKVNHVVDPGFRQFGNSSGPWQGQGWKVLNQSVVTTELGMVTSLYCTYPTQDVPIVQKIGPYLVPTYQAQGQINLWTVSPTPLLNDTSVSPFVSVKVEFLSSSLVPVAVPYFWKLSADAPIISQDSQTTSWVVDKGNWFPPPFPIPQSTYYIELSIGMSLGGSACLRRVGLTYNYLGDTVFQNTLRYAQIALFLLSMVNTTICLAILSKGKRKWLIDWGNIILLRRMPVYGGARWVPILHILASAPWVWDVLRSVASKRLPFLDDVPVLGPFVPVIFMIFVVIQSYAWWGPLLCWSAIVTSAGVNKRRRIVASVLGTWSVLSLLAQLLVYGFFRSYKVGRDAVVLSILEIIVAGICYLVELIFFLQNTFNATPLWITRAMEIFNLSPELVSTLDHSFEGLIFRESRAYVRQTLLREKLIGKPVPEVKVGKHNVPRYDTVSPWPTDVIRFPPSVWMLTKRFAGSVLPKSKLDFDDPFWHTLSTRLLLGLCMLPVQSLLLMVSVATIWIDGLAIFSCALASFTHYTSSEVLNSAARLQPILHPIIIVIFALLFILVIHHQIATARNYLVLRAKLRLGDYSMIPTGRLAFAHGDDRKLHGGMGLLHAVQFVGYTIGFGLFGLLWSIIVTLILFFLLTLLILAIVAIPAVQQAILNYLSSSIFIAVLVAAVLSAIIQVLQRLLVAYTSVLPGTTTIVGFNTPFVHLDYIFIYFDAIQGLLSFFKRLILGLLSSAFYATRVDISIMSDDWRSNDGGLTSFLAVVVMDHAYQNDIVLFFTLVLIRSLREQARLEHLLYDPDAQVAHDALERNLQGYHFSSLAAPNINNVSVLDVELQGMAEKHIVDVDYVHRKQAKTRWFLAYTLLRNPQLQVLRKHRLERENVESDKKTE